MEQVLIEILKLTSDKNTQALLLGKFIQEFGALSNEGGKIVKQILEGGSE